MIAVAEGVNVVAGSGSDIAEHGAEAGFLADEIFRCGQFHVRRIAFKGCHRQSRPFRKRRVIGEIAAPVARRAAMSVENHIEPECLRRLRDAQPRALGRRFDVSGFADLLDGVRDLDRRNGRAGEGRGLDRARNQRRRDEWARRVVDENDIRLLAGKRFQSGMNRSLACCPAICRRLVAQGVDGGIEDGRIIGIQNRLHRKDLRMAAKRLHGPENHGFPADRTILFRSSRAGTKPASGCDKDGCSPLWFGHCTQ